MSQQTGRRKEPATATAVAPTKMPADDVRSALGDVLDRAGFMKERIIVTRNGKPLAALVSMADLERLLAIEAAA